MPTLNGIWQSMYPERTPAEQRAYDKETEAMADAALARAEARLAEQEGGTP